MDWEMLSHTSEAKFRAYGDTVEKRFSNAARAMFDIMFDVSNLKATVRKKIIVKGKDGRSLLHNWLEELLLMLDTDLFVLTRIEKIKITRIKETWTLDAILLGCRADDNTPRKGPEVKAVTHSEMEVTDAYVQAVLDV